MKGSFSEPVKVLKLKFENKLLTKKGFQSKYQVKNNKFWNLNSYEIFRGVYEQFECNLSSGVFFVSERMGIE